ncbi:MAG: TIGR04197 family type VII secretion effector [Lachnospiraceae bacterium]
MSDIKSDLSLAIDKEKGLKSKCVGLGTESIETAEESNIDGVTDNASVYEDCASLLKSYKELLDTDATRIRDLGVSFFDFDHDMASKM